MHKYAVKICTGPNERVLHASVILSNHQHTDFNVNGVIQVLKKRGGVWDGMSFIPYHTITRIIVELVKQEEDA